MCIRDRRAAYIVKPPASSRGRGVRMLREGDFERLTATRRGRTGDADGARRDDKSDKTSRKSVLVQRYIRDPHLLDGYKYDLRVYVALTSLDPLRVFLYREGLVRLATEKYVDGGADPSLSPLSCLLSSLPRAGAVLVAPAACSRSICEMIILSVTSWKVSERSHGTTARLPKRCARHSSGH